MLPDCRGVTLFPSCETSSLLTVWLGGGGILGVAGVNGAGISAMTGAGGTGAQFSCILYKYL